jgi:acetolactate synthase-1/2/3 large subunit
MLGIPVSDSLLKDIIEKIQKSERPVIYAGSAIRTSGAHKDFLKLIEKLNIPVVNAWNATDSLYYDHPLCVGCGGSFGDRAANFAVQNSDLVLSLGCRLSTRQVSFNYEAWAREAYKIMVDIDSQELIKPTLNIDLPVRSDVKEFIQKLNIYLSELESKSDENVFNNEEWLSRCNNWKNKYPVVNDEKHEQTEMVNVYAFLDKLTSKLSEGMEIVAGNGSACACIHAYKLKKDQRLIVNSGAASMGYDLPAAIGACFAIDKQPLICVTGDGSIQMNLQELQTIIHHNLPIKIFIINNQGYQSIRITQRSFFEEPLVGIGDDSGDLSFPDMQKIAKAYGFPFLRCHTNEELDDSINNALSADSYFICELMVDTDQGFEPKSASKRLPDGRMVSAPLEDLQPFLNRDEFKDNMIIDTINDNI